MNRITPINKIHQSDLVFVSRRIVEKMEASEFFLPPHPALANLKKVIPDLDSALVNARGGDKEMIAIKNNQKDLVQDLLTELADYVTRICKGDLILLLSSGFDISTDGPGILPVSIEILNVKLGPPGEVTTRVRRVSGARAYVHEYTSEPPTYDTNWFHRPSGLCTHTFKGLTSEKRYWFRVTAIGSGVQLAYSPIVTMVVQ
jgi:hypothetical protein